MTLYLDPTGHSTFGIGICGRCSRKMFLDELYPDPNTPGLLVCVDDIDDYDPYRLPSRPEDNIVLPFVRPDISVADTAPIVSSAPVSDDTVWADDFWATSFWADDFWASS